MEDETQQSTCSSQDLFNSQPTCPDSVSSGNNTPEPSTPVKDISSSKMNEFTPVKRMKLERDQTGVTGYVHNVDEQRISTANNPYFDVDIKTSPSCKAKIRVMADEKYDRSSFLKLQEEKLPLGITNLSPLKSGRHFFNAKAGASIQRLERLNFNASDETDLTIAEIIASPSAGLFSITGEIRWLEYARTVTVRGYEKQLKEGQLIDCSNCPINITIWGAEFVQSVMENTTYHITNLAVSWWNDQMRLATTTSSVLKKVPKEHFDWNRNPTISNNTRICCPAVISSLVNNYISCPNNDCRKKIDLTMSESKTVTCHHCNRMMLIRKCTVSYSINVVIEKNGKKTKLTAFPECVKEYFKKSGETDLKEYATALLEAENVDFTYDRKKVITKLEDHEDAVN